MGYRALSNWFVGTVVLLFALVTGVQTLRGEAQIRLVPASGRVADVPKVEAMERPYFSELSDWAAENFWTKGPLIAVSAGAKFFGFNTSGDERVLPGRGGWMFYGDDVHRELYDGELSDAYKTHLKNVLLERRAWLASHGIDYVLIAGPAAQAVYPENVSWRMANASPQTRVERFLAELNEASPGIAYAPYERLRARKTEVDVPLYHQNDSHWTQAGAAEAVSGMLEARGIEPVVWTYQPITTRPGSFGRIIGYPLSGPSARLTPAFGERARRRDSSEYCERLGKDAVRACREYTRAGRGGRVLQLGDSFGNYSSTALADSFGETLIVNLWETDGIPEKRFPVSIILDYKPDLVVELVAEYRIAPCSQTQIYGCNSRLGVPNPFVFDQPVDLSKNDLSNLGRSSIELTVDFSDPASLSGNRQPKPLSLGQIPVRPGEYVKATVTPPAGFTGAIVGGFASQTDGILTAPDLRTEIVDADGRTAYEVYVLRTPDQGTHYLRFDAERGFRDKFTISADTVDLETLMATRRMRVDLAAQVEGNADRTRTALRLLSGGLDASDYLQVTVTPPLGFSGRLIGGFPSNLPPGLTADQLEVNVTNADGQRSYTVFAVPGADDEARFLRVYSDQPLRGEVEIGLKILSERQAATAVPVTIDLAQIRSAATDGTRAAFRLPVALEPGEAYFKVTATPSAEVSAEIIGVRDLGQHPSFAAARLRQRMGPEDGRAQYTVLAAPDGDLPEVFLRFGDEEPLTGTVTVTFEPMTRAQALDWAMGQ